MNNLHRSLAPISEAAWAEIEQEARRTFTTRVAGRKVVDVPDPAGLELSAVGTGRLSEAPCSVEGVRARARVVAPVVELRAEFIVSRQAVDDVARGATDSDWDNVKMAAERLALAEDGVVFTGAPELVVTGLIPGSSNPVLPTPTQASEAPDVVARAMTQLRSVGVSGPYALVLSSDLYTAVWESSDHGYPIGNHIRRILGAEGEIVYAPALSGGVLMSLRGGDYTLHLGQDVSIGYLSHDEENVRLYLQESLTFRLNTAEAAVVIA